MWSQPVAWGCVKTKLLVGGSDNADARLRSNRALHPVESRSRPRRAYNVETVTAVSNVDLERAEARNLKRRIEPIRERRHVLDADALGFAIVALRRNRDKAAVTSSVRWVSGSCIGSMPASSSTVATQIEFEPDMGGVSSGSMMMKPIYALGGPWPGLADLRGERRRRAARRNCARRRPWR
jgi:hypothetical protein